MSAQSSFFAFKVLIFDVWRSEKGWRKTNRCEVWDDGALRILASCLATCPVAVHLSRFLIIMDAL